MRRVFAQLLLVCFLFSVLPVLQAVETPNTRAQAQRRARQMKKNKKYKYHKAKWGKSKKGHTRASY